MAIVRIREQATKVIDVAEAARITLTNLGDEPVRIGDADVDRESGRELRPTASLVLEAFSGDLWGISEIGVQALGVIEERTIATNQEDNTNG